MNVSSLDNGCKLTCRSENMVGEAEASVDLDILCKLPRELLHKTFINTHTGNHI